MRLQLCALACLGFAHALPAATTFTWTGNRSTSVNSGGNWSGGTAPTSDSVNTALQFPAITSTANNAVYFDSNFDAYSVTFSGAFPAYYLFGSYDPSVSLGLGAGGITVGSGSTEIPTLGLNIRLLSNQTWALSGNLSVAYNNISGDYKITKTGSGSLTLSGYNTFTGGFDLQGGILYLGGSSSLTEGYGPVGTGTLTFRSGTTIAASDYAVAIENALLLQSGASFGIAGTSLGLRFSGSTTLQSTSTSITVNDGSGVEFSGNIGEALAGSSLTLTGGKKITLSGVNTYTGGTIANGSGIIFYSSESIPASGSISATNNGYIGTMTSGGLATIISKITNPSGYAGSLGLDSAYKEPTVFSDTITLTGFSPVNFVGLGTFSLATLGTEATLTRVGTTGDYKFGGGNGTLYVETALAASGTAGVTVSSPLAYTEDTRFTVYLRGTNGFSGNVSVSGSNLIFDSSAALPSGPSLSLGAYGYVGYTEYASNIENFASFKSRIASSTSTSIIGIDSASGEGRFVGDAIDLSTFSQPVYLGTTSYVTLNGTIKAPGGGTLFLTGVNDGHLKINSALAAADVTAVKVGYASSSPSLRYVGFVELASGASTYAGNTTLDSGYLVLSASSTAAGTTVTSGPLGSGTLVVSSSAQSPGLSAPYFSDVTLHNNIVLNSSVTVGHEDNFIYSNNALTLNGTISGTGGVSLAGNTTLTLNGNNTFSGGFTGTGGGVIANHNSALGSGAVSLAGTYIQFTTSAPTIGGLNGSYGSVSVTSGANLTINQSQSGEFSGAISGENITVTKTGSATLTLGGNNTYSGTTQINQGTLAVSWGEPLGSSTVALGGGKLQVSSGVAFGNTITFSAPSRITGNGTISSAFTAGTNAILSPGASPGTLTFTNGLTFGSGGTYEIEIQSASGSPGSGFDTLDVTGVLNFSTPSTAFKFDLISLSTSGVAGNVADFSATSTYSWQIAYASGGITGFTGANTTISTSSFSNATNNGIFSLSVASLGDGAGLYLNFTPVPEPATWGLLFAGTALLSFARTRRTRHAT